ncbi:CopG family transcriptional regulator [Natronolimnobius sp. AArcel1]|uniref:CopG family transcriptional regulator n=1 Tax=Natronolimnobius sp. AArcel1 TaxID=1679093 RepID=UPI0013EA02D4|nr:CopG family transcriptional regulator [Natronolimnobius sp. AArcel1]NGM70281.1 CopG family transcriptional regulator [Natronolimnobius sp. AArcel1]
MGNKNKTISFRVSEEAFESLQDIAEERDISLSAVFRDYVDLLVDHDGQVTVVPDDELSGGTIEHDGEGEEIAFPPSVEVPKSFIREHERLELEADHLREQLDEYKSYVTELQDRLEDEQNEILLLDDLDEEDESYQLR